MGAMRRFRLVLIKPSHYDDDGYVIRWWRSIDSVEFAGGYLWHRRGLRGARVLGPEVAIDIEAIDETNTRIDIAGAASHRFAPHGDFGLVALVGVQSNQYPRALDIARPLRAAGRAGRDRAGSTFRVASSMLEGGAVDLDACRELGVSMFAGECEGRFDACCATRLSAGSKPLYDFMNDLPGSRARPPPFLPKEYRRSHARHQHQLRRRSRLPLPMLVLHHHQRAGP